MGGGKAPKDFLERKKKEEIEEGTQKTLFGKDPRDRCSNCGHRRSEHAEFGNYDSKALTNKCNQFVKQGVQEK